VEEEEGQGGTELLTTLPLQPTVALAKMIFNGLCQLPTVAALLEEKEELPQSLARARLGEPGAELAY
jgi:hypothetical protein